MDEARAAAERIALIVHGAPSVPGLCRTVGVGMLACAVCTRVADAVAQATRAERERCAKFVEERWPVKREDGTWTMVPRPVTKECIPKTMALAEALRRAPTEPTPGGHNG